jgi:hypothetical protein
LEIILVFRPLIESGLIVPVTPTTTLCYHCLGKSALPDVDRKRFDSSLRRFAKRFETETEATLECWEDGSVGLNIEGSGDLGWVLLRIHPVQFARCREGVWPHKNCG